MGSKKNKLIGFFDIETYEELKGRIAMIGHKFKDFEYVYFLNSKDYFDYLSKFSKENKIIIYGFNSSNFDLLKIFDELSINNDDFQIVSTLSSGGLIVKMGVKYKKSLFEFRDLRGVFRFTTLDNIAKDILGKGKEVFDVKNIKEVNEDVIRYNKRDVVILEEIYNYVYNFFKDDKILTSAGLSFRYLKNNYLKDKIELMQHRGIREIYFGGRTEVFKFLGKDIRVYDVNSLYPYVMKNFSYPIGELYEENNINKPGYSYAEVFVSDEYIPFLPYKINNKLYFLKGRLEGVWTNYELKKCVENGYKVNVIKGFVCDNSEYIFERFIDDIYKKRLEAKRNKNKPLDTMYKLIMNSCYGKFGSKKITSYAKLIKFSDVKEGEIILKPLVLNGEVYCFVSRNREFKGYNDYLTASYITAYARSVLFDYLNKDVKNLMYCDTDSIHLKENSSVLDNYLGDDIGLLKVEYEGKEGCYRLPKVYVIKDGKKDIVKLKGVRITESIKNLLIKNIFNKHEFEVEQERVITLRELFRRKGYVSSFFKIEKNVKKIQFDKYKRKPIGNDTVPFLIDEVI